MSAAKVIRERVLHIQPREPFTYHCSSNLVRAPRWIKRRCLAWSRKGSFGELTECVHTSEDKSF